MNQKMARNCRIASRWVGYGGIIACIAAAVVWYLLDIRRAGRPFDRKVLFGIPTLPEELLIISAIAATIIIFAIVLRICARLYATAPERIASTKSLEKTAQEFLPDGSYKVLRNAAGKTAKVAENALLMIPFAIGCAVTTYVFAKAAWMKRKKYKKGYIYIHR